MEGAMEKRFPVLVFSLLVIVVFCSILFAPSVQAAKKSLAVMKFTCTAGSGTSWWYNASWDIGEGMAEMLTTALVQTGQYRVLERQQINDVLGEQDLGASGRVDPATAAKIGKVLGAQYLVYGTVNEFEYSKGGEGGGVRYKGFGIGGKQARAHIGMDVRIVDAVTSEVVFSGRSTAEATRKGFNVSYSGSDFGTSMGAFRQTPMGEATRKGIEDSVQKIVAQFGTEAPEAPRPSWSGKLLVGDDGALVIKAGNKEGLKVGEVLDVYRPKTVKAGGETLTVGEEKIGKIVVTSVGDAASMAVPQEGSGFKTGDIVKTQ
jgi:curli biogenesis system outer membrane secretion channel CsgG